MREKDVPQDSSSFYRGIQRACYAVSDEGKYVVAKSRGWDDERVVTEQALLELEEHVEEQRLAVRAGERSPLAYHLARRQMTPKLFAMHVGLSGWRVRRHLKPRVFEKLPRELLERYAACLDTPVEELCEVPSEARHVFLVDADE